MRFNGPPSHPVSSRVFVFLIQVVVEAGTTTTMDTATMVATNNNISSFHTQYRCRVHMSYTVTIYLSNNAHPMLVHLWKRRKSMLKYDAKI